MLSTPWCPWETQPGSESLTGVLGWGTPRALLLSLYACSSEVGSNRVQRKTVLIRNRDSPPRACWGRARSPESTCSEESEESEDDPIWDQAPLLLLRDLGPSEPQLKVGCKGSEAQFKMHSLARVGHNLQLPPPQDGAVQFTQPTTRGRVKAPGDGKI